jgi:hypothetical protein
MKRNVERTGRPRAFKMSSSKALSTSARVFVGLDIVGDRDIEFFALRGIRIDEHMERAGIRDE